MAKDSSLKTPKGTRPVQGPTNDVKKIPGFTAPMGKQPVPPAAPGFKAGGMVRRGYGSARGA